MTKTAAKSVAPKALRYTPRFEYGDQAEVAVVCGPEDGTQLGAGYVRMTGAEIPWTIKYDEVILILEGVLEIDLAGETLRAGVSEAIWLPAGTRLVYRAEHALMFYAIQPADWASR